MEIFYMELRLKYIDLRSGNYIWEIIYNDGWNKLKKSLVLKPNQTNIIKVDGFNVFENPIINIANDTNDSAAALNNTIKVLDDYKTLFILSGYDQGTYSISRVYYGDVKNSSVINFTSFNLTKANNVDSEISSNNVYHFIRRYYWWCSCYS